MKGYTVPVNVIVFIVRSERYQLYEVNVNGDHEACMIVRLSLLRKTILIPEYLAFMCVCVFVDGCISQF